MQASSARLLAVRLVYRRPAQVQPLRIPQQRDGDTVSELLITLAVDLLVGAFVAVVVEIARRALTRSVA